MKYNIKSNKELTKDYLEELYKIFEENMKVVSKGTIYETTFTNDYKNYWIDNILSNDNLKVISFYDNNVFIGYLIVIEEDDIFIHEFQLIKEYQGDGKSFRYVVKTVLDLYNNGKIFHGRIWKSNLKAMIVFRTMGAIINEKDEFELTYSQAKDWYEKI